MVLPALGTLGTGFACFVAIGDVAKARGRYGVKAPAHEMPPEADEEDRQSFARSYRQYMNLIEWIAIAQPVFWTSALMAKEAYGTNSKAFKWVTYAAALWPIWRIGYGLSFFVHF